jgi:hypothetical protein
MWHLANFAGGPGRLPAGQSHGRLFMKNTILILQHAIAYCNIRVRLSAVVRRGPPSAVARRPPWPAARRVSPCIICITMLSA